MKLPAGIDAIVGHANLFDLFEIEESFTISERVQRHNAHRRRIGVEDGEGEHGGDTLSV